MRTCALGIVLALALGACTDSNLAGPRGGGAGGTIVFSSDRADRNFEIWRISGDGRGLVRLTNDPQHNDYAPALSRDGRRIAWEREVSAGTGVLEVEIWVMNVDGTDAHVVVSNGAENRSPAWGADDRSLVFASYVGGDYDVWSVPLDANARAGGEPVNLTRSPFADQWPRVSPDGGTIVFQTNRDFDFEIYSMRADGGDPRNLTNSPDDDRFPAWSPDGSTIVWSRFETSFDVWAMAADGSGQRAVVRTPFDELAPSVSPDGRQIVVQSTASGERLGLYVLPMSGGEPRALTGSAGGASGAEQAPWWGGSAD